MVTRRRVLPVLTLVTVPSELTVATSGLEEDQVTVPAQSAGVTAASKVNVSLADKVISSLFSVRPATVSSGPELGWFEGDALDPGRELLTTGSEEGRMPLGGGDTAAPELLGSALTLLSGLWILG